MPEGPEVVTIVNELNELIKDQIITDVVVDESKSKLPIESLTLEEFKNKIAGRKILEIKRVGKNIIFVLDNDTCLLIHLLMTGQIWVMEDKPQYHRLTIILNSKQKLHLADRSTWVTFKIFNSEELEGFLNSKSFGIDVLSSKFILGEFTSILLSPRKIHSLLLDQKALSGLGNIYVNEALFLSGILPHRKASSLSKTEVNKLFSSIKTVLKDAIKHKGTTFSDYRTPKGNKGTHQNYLNVFKRDKKACKFCKTKIKREKIGGRGVFYCGKCQK